jgi:hypothetical protein
VQTNLVLSKSADSSPLAFTVKCAWKSRSTLSDSLDEPAEVVFYCSACAEREFGD